MPKKDFFLQSVLEAAHTILSSRNNIPKKKVRHNKS